MGWFASVDDSLFPELKKAKQIYLAFQNQLVIEGFLFFLFIFLFFQNKSGLARGSKYSYCFTSQKRSTTKGNSTTINKSVPGILTVPDAGHNAINAMYNTDKLSAPWKYILQWVA